MCSDSTATSKAERSIPVFIEALELSAIDGMKNNEPTRGGGGGNRTRVREPLMAGATCVVDDLSYREQRPSTGYVFGESQKVSIHPAETPG